jgi:hypothetical protein
MSLILEALKKSEAKRRLGEAPDLGTPFTSARRRGSLLPLLLAAIAAAGVLGWWLTRAPTPPPAADASAAKVATAPKTAASATTPSRSPGAGHTPVATQAPSFDNVAPPSLGGMPTRRNVQPSHDVVAPLAPPPAPTGAPPQVVSIAERAKAGGYDGRPQMPQTNKRLPPNMHRVAPSTDPKAAPVAAAAAAKTAAASNTPALAKAAKTADMKGVAPPPATASAPAAATASSTSAPSAAPVKADTQLAAVAPAAAPAAAPAVRAPTEAAKAKPDVQFYYELPFSVRKALPPLRLSMHVYAGDPAQRFVVLNDSRLSEGDKTADEVTLREVRRDGAVLEFQGQRFFYPRDGY